MWHEPVSMLKLYLLHMLIKLYDKHAQISLFIKNLSWNKDGHIIPTFNVPIIVQMIRYRNNGSFRNYSFVNIRCIFTDCNCGRCNRRYKTECIINNTITIVNLLFNINFWLIWKFWFDKNKLKYKLIQLI